MSDDSEIQQVLPDAAIQRLADQAEFGVTSLRGVPAEPVEQARPYTVTVETVSASLDHTRARLAEKRAQRDEINAEIKLLVGEAELLERMWRIAQAAEKAAAKE